MDYARRTLTAATQEAQSRLDGWLTAEAKAIEKLELARREVAQARQDLEELDSTFRYLDER